MRVSKDGRGRGRGLMVRDARSALLTMTGKCSVRGRDGSYFFRARATWSAVTMGAALPQLLRM